MFDTTSQTRTLRQHGGSDRRTAHLAEAIIARIEALKRSLYRRKLRFRCREKSPTLFKDVVFVLTYFEIRVVGFTLFCTKGGGLVIYEVAVE